MSASIENQKKSTLDKILPFMVGGGSGMFATSIIQPIDMVKIQIQLKSEALGKGGRISPFGVIRDMMNNGRGLKQFYKGLDSALMR